MRTVGYAQETVSIIGPLLCRNVSEGCKTSSSSGEFHFPGISISFFNHRVISIVLLFWIAKLFGVIEFYLLFIKS